MRRAGFTLLELLIVLMILGLVAGLTTLSLRGGSVVDRAGETLVTRLLDARVIALRAGAPAAFVAVAEDDRLRMWVEVAGAVDGDAGVERVREREMMLPGVVLIDETPDFGRDAADETALANGARAVFGASGRTPARRWVLARAGASAGAAGDSGGRMVTIEFDPITGVPELHRER